jgi:hypothetical protein
MKKRDKVEDSLHNIVQNVRNLKIAYIDDVRFTHIFVVRHANYS